MPAEFSKKKSPEEWCPSSLLGDFISSSVSSPGEQQCIMPGCRNCWGSREVWHPERTLRTRPLWNMEFTNYVYLLFVCSYSNRLTWVLSSSGVHAYLPIYWNFETITYLFVVLFASQNEWAQAGMRSWSRSRHILVGAGAAETVCSEPESEPEPEKTGRLRLRKGIQLWKNNELLPAK